MNRWSLLQSDMYIEEKVLGELSRRHIQMCWSRSAWQPENKQNGTLLGSGLWGFRWFVLKLEFRDWGTRLSLSLKSTEKSMADSCQCKAKATTIL